MRSIIMCRVPGKKEAFPRRPSRCRGRLPDTVVISCRNLGRQFNQKPVKRLKNFSTWITFIRAKPLISREGKGVAVFHRLKRVGADG